MVESCVALVMLAWFIVFFVFLFMTAMYCSELAEKKGRNAVAWWIFGICLGPVAMAVLWMGPSRKEQDFKLEE
ncbi:hypothetical protein [Desulfobaculum bizertense]|uniref:Phospholipase_D-nuclease N-terminal n=1 Tax=Desulfobaculum bizertense DSM 18034 TaxID=1121442 RepID=A0A1T4VPM5_9BACT|nr:hypothetical protein [Desulfobaculum bizertense]UIJ38233.1 hypothetical protein LWC08_01350 [Desulfobaculum bizertense]SKA66924.1 hypothetical protein SAMN02745702_00716 [Desulfobaculum bizertense DSM 18034]